MNAAVNHEFDNICEYIGLMNFPFLITDLKFSFLKDDLDDVGGRFVREKFVEVFLFGLGAVRGVFKDLVYLKDFWKVLFDSITPVDCFIAIADDFEDFVVDAIADVSYVGLFDVGRWLFQHCYSLIIRLSLKVKLWFKS